MSDQENKDIRLLLLIRHFELALLDLFSKGKLHGTTHTCLGQEYIPVALMPLLSKDDYFFSNHRGHGHYLSRFENPEGLLAEIMGKEGAICMGMGGSQHIKHDRYMSTGVQGEGLSMAAGVALHFKRQQTGDMAVAFIGDGTWGQGIVYETLNIASLWKLPLLVIVENNRIAQSTPTELNMAGTIEDRVNAFRINYDHIKTNNIDKIRTILREPLEHARTNMTPLVIEFDTVRLGPHSKGDDTREIEILKQLEKRDWYGELRQKEPLFSEIEVEVKEYLSKLIEEMEQRPPSTVCIDHGR